MGNPIYSFDPRSPLYAPDHRSLHKSSSSSSSSSSHDYTDVYTKTFHADPSSRITTQPFSSTEKFLEIVGPPNLARFIRSSLLCSEAMFPFRYRITELLGRNQRPEKLQPAGNESARDIVLNNRRGRAHGRRKFFV